MATKASNINEMLNTLEEEDYKAVVSFIQFLSVSRKQKKAKESKAALKEIQSMFTDDKGWGSEKEMLEDMAAFRREKIRS